MKFRVACFAAVMALGLSDAAAAAQVYVIHGIPGQDVGAPPDLLFRL